MKRLIAIIFCLAFVLAALPVAASVSSEGCLLTLTEDDHTGYPVTGISGNRYQYNHEVTKLVVPPNIIRLGYGLFIGCSNLSQIELHDKIQVIGERAFERTAYYEDETNRIDGVLYIGDALIRADPQMISHSYTVRQGTRIIADGAFRDCKNLHAISLPDTVEYVGTDAFAGTSLFENQEAWQDGMLIADHVLLALHPTYSGVLSVPENIKTIADGACKGSRITALITSDSLRYIGYHAFWDCRNLQTVRLGKSVQTLGRGPFRLCDELSEICVQEDNPYFAVKDGVLYDKQQTTVIRCPHRRSDSVTLPASVTKISAYAFERCAELESVVIPEGCLFIGNSAFSTCEKLTDVALPESMEYIDHYAFAYCNGLESVVIPDRVNYLGKYVFTCCMGLHQAIIGNGVTTLREGLFESAKNLNNVTLGNSICKISGSVFWDTDYISNVARYKNGLLIASDRYLLKAAHDVTSCNIPAGVTVIADGAFENLTEELREIRVPSSVKSFDRDAFSDIPETVPVYYAGSWSSFARRANFDPARINLYTTDFDGMLGAFAALCAVLTSLTLGMLTFEYHKRKSTQNIKTEDGHEQKPNQE